MTLVALVLAALALQAPPPAPSPPAGIVTDGAYRPPRFEAPTATVPVDPLPVPDRVLDVYLGDPDFQYDRPQAEGPSLWSRFWAWVWRTFVEPVFESTGPVAQRVALIGLAVLTLAWVLTRLLRAEGSGLFGRTDARRAEVGPLLDVEDIEAVDVGARLAEALAAGDYREAVRWRYLAVLQRLAAAGVVAWRRDKTNRVYVAEARAADASLGRALARATRVFDYVWYGERPVDRARFETLRPLFDRADAVRTPVPTP